MNTALSNDTLAKLLRHLWHHLSRHRQRQFGLLLVLMLIGAFAEIFSLGAVLPFLAVLASPDRVFGFPFVAEIARFWRITTATGLVLPMTFMFALVTLAAGSVRLLVMWASARLAFATGADISIEVYRRTLYQPYKIHLERNSSEVINGITGKVNAVVHSVLLPALTFIGSVILLTAIAVALLAINPMVATAAALGFGACYVSMMWLFRHRLKRNSQTIARESTEVFKALQEGLGGIRDVLLDGTQQLYCDTYRKADRPLRWAQGQNVFIMRGPRFAIETVSMLLVIALAYSFSYHAGGISAALPTLGVLALGAIRLLPTFQQCYGSWGEIVGNQASLVDTLHLLEQPMPADTFQPMPAPLEFRGFIRFDDVSFRYGSKEAWVLDDLCFTIPKGSRIGIVGKTGCGKSTALDLLMGLLEPTEGRILVDDQPIIGDRLRAWQQTIAHVPQSIYLADVTLAENIAFGVPRELIDMDRVRMAASQAQLANYIESLPNGYHSFVGERGIRLSGGQRQRIGIARALYKQACILVFDEATSALDNATEKAVMDTIESLDRDVTVLLIAHRLTTVQHCDSILELAHGRVVAEGSYEYLIKCSPSFRKMVGGETGSLLEGTE
jgi:ATP-binding cassette subfamily B protein